MILAATPAAASDARAEQLTPQQEMDVLIEVRELCNMFAEWKLSREAVSQEADKVRQTIINFHDRFAGGGR